ncbi:hypothetical protein ABW19_dt0204818 [Dactylella cylindrospora]|nr:hypothetical protein ABW19_dt0204818 [Dactylella cylindrospora]
MVARNAKAPAVGTRTSARISTRLRSSNAAVASTATVISKTKVTKSSKSTKDAATKAATKATTKGASKGTSKSSKKKKADKEDSDPEDPPTKVTATTTIVQITEPPTTSEEDSLIVPLVTYTPDADTHPGITHLLKTNPKLTTVISRNACHIFSASGLKEPVDPFQALSSGIIAQQVSGAAAKSIKTKFIALFNDAGEFPSPGEIIKLDIPTLRTAGLSQRKAEYISGLAQKFHEGELTNDMLLTSTDEIVTEKLLEVRGLGLWSIQMFLLFGLKRTDVFATGDLGIQRGMAIMAGKDVNKLKYAKEGKGKWKYMSEEDMVRLSEPFKPYRSILSWYLWRLADTDVEVMKEK